jgi:type IV pilus assembly protein PilM
MDVVLVAAKKDMINDYVSVIMESGLNPVIIDIDSFALENMLAINYEIDKEETIAIVNVGGSVTNINIIKNNISGFTRDIFKGGNQITEEIQRQLHVDHEEAEHIKVGTKVDLTSQPIIQNVLKASAESLANEIGNSIEFFQSTTTYEKIARLYLSGGGIEKLRILILFCNSRLGYPLKSSTHLKK